MSHLKIEITLIFHRVIIIKSKIWFIFHDSQVWPCNSDIRRNLYHVLIIQLYNVRVWSFNNDMSCKDYRFRIAKSSDPLENVTNETVFSWIWISENTTTDYDLTHTRPRDMARSRPPFWIFSFAAWKWVNMDGNWRNFDGNISSYV